MDSKLIDLISDQLKLIHRDVENLRKDMRVDFQDVYNKIDNLKTTVNEKFVYINDAKITPLQIEEAKTKSKLKFILSILCAGLIGGTGGNIGAKLYFKDEKQKVEGPKQPLKE